MTGDLGHGWACPESPEEREAWGCDERAEDPIVAECTCESGCGLCQGERVIRFHRCPSHRLTPKIAEAVFAWRRLRKHRTWPDAGGVGDQSAWFVDAVDILDAELARAEKREREKAERKAKRLRRGARNRG